MAGNRELARVLRGTENKSSGINITLNLDMASFAKVIKDIVNKEGDEEFQKVEGLTPSVS